MNKELIESKKTLESIKDAKDYVEQRQNFNAGIIYGLIFGMLGSYFVTIVYEEFVKDLKGVYHFLAILIPFSALIFLMYIGMKEHQKSSDFKLELEFYENMIKRNISLLEKKDKKK